MNVLITADIHCGYGNRISDCVWALKTIDSYGYKNNIQHVICLGDLFHNRSYITIDLLNIIYAFFKVAKCHWILFPGNHDMFMKTSWKINSVKLLEKYTTVYNDISQFELGNRQFCIVPFMHYEEQYINAVNELELRCDNDAILLTHIGINNAVNNSCFLSKYWSSINFDNTKFKLILSGHFHNYQSINNKIYYAGSPIPFRFDEGMVPHGFLILNTDTFGVKFVNIRSISNDCPPDFVTIIDTDDFAKKKNIISSNKIRVVMTREYSKLELDELKNKLMQIGARSVSLMRHASEEPTIKQTEPVNKESIFTQWLETQDISKYDKKLLIELYSVVAEEAEDLYNRSSEGEENEVEYR